MPFKSRILICCGLFLPPVLPAEVTESVTISADSGCVGELLARFSF
jgi:hypothetical protein